VARRLALGDRVVWIGKEGPLGTITRITAHEVEVRWDGETLTRYRRMHLHDLRHVKTHLRNGREWPQGHG
jgi:preprotein translocase subunit YajC